MAGVILSIAVLAIGSVSAQQAFAGTPVILDCFSNGNGNWNDENNWTGCNGPTPDSSDLVTINDHDIVITGDEQADGLFLLSPGTLFIDCDASLTVISEGGGLEGDTTNHGSLTSPGGNLLLSGTLFNSGTLSGVVEEGGSIVQISTKCTQPIGGTVGSMDTVSLLVAGAQGNMGWWSLALVGMVAAGAAITYKLTSKKTEQ